MLLTMEMHGADRIVQQMQEIVKAGNFKTTKDLTKPLKEEIDQSIKYLVELFK